MEKANNISKKMATDARLKNMLLKVSDDHSGFTQDELASKSGIPRRTLRRIETQAIGKLTDYIAKFIKEEGSD